MGDHPPRTRKDQAPDNRQPSLAASTTCRIISITDDPEPPFWKPAICLKSSDDGQCWGPARPSCCFRHSARSPAERRCGRLRQSWRYPGSPARWSIGRASDPRRGAGSTTVRIVIFTSLATSRRPLCSVPLVFEVFPAPSGFRRRVLLQPVEDRAHDLIRRALGFARLVWAQVGRPGRIIR